MFDDSTSQTLALGGITEGVYNYEMCAAYATIANGGEYNKPTLYSKVVDHDGNVLLDGTGESHTVIKDSTAYLLTNAMEDVVNSGTGTACQLPNMPVAGKTGTTTSNKDLWFCGFTPYYTCAVWGGYDDNKECDYDTSFRFRLWKGIMSRMEQGPLTGSYARDVRVIVYDGKMHPVDSNEISFMLAGRQAFSEAFKNAGPKILEPIYDVEVFVPSDKLGDVMSDMQGRRGMIMGMSSEKGYEKLAAKVPLKEMSNYSTALSSLTGGRASFIMKFASYELVPTDVQNKLMKEFEEQEKEEV